MWRCCFLIDKSTPLNFPIFPQHLRQTQSLSQSSLAQATSQVNLIRSSLSSIHHRSSIFQTHIKRSFRCPTSHPTMCCTRRVLAGLSSKLRMPPALESSSTRLLQPASYRHRPEHSHSHPLQQSWHPQILQQRQTAVTRPGRLRPRSAHSTQHHSKSMSSDPVPDQMDGVCIVFKLFYAFLRSSFFCLQPHREHRIPRPPRRRCAAALCLWPTLRL
jgi:hypothetical protein